MQVEKNVNTYSFINAFVFTLGFLQRNLRYFPKNSILRVSTSSFRRNQSCEDQDIRWLGICNLQGVELMILKTLYDRIPCISRIPDWTLRITSFTCLNPISDGVKGHVQVTGGGLIGPPLYGDPRRPQTWHF